MMKGAYGQRHDVAAFTLLSFVLLPFGTYIVARCIEGMTGSIHVGGAVGLLIWVGGNAYLLYQEFR